MRPAPFAVSLLSPLGTVSDSPAPPPSPEQLLLVNDEIAPRPLPVWRYLAAGAIVSAESRGVVLWRALRALPALLGIALPVAALALVARVAGGSPDEQVDSIAALTERVDGWLAVVPATADVILVILLAVLLIGVRGAFDALLYGRLRELASGIPRPPAERMRRGYLAHSGMALLSFGLYVGAVMFTSPIVRAMARVTAERAGTPEATVVVGLGVGIVFGAIAWVRLLTVLASCWIAWRPRFLAATIVAALTEPIRRVRVYGAVLLCWLIGHGVAVGGAALSLNALLGPDGRLLDTIPPVAGVTLGAAAALGLAVTSWVECTLLLVVGHRLGEVDVAATRRRRPVASTVAPVESGGGVGFVPPVRGAFVAAQGAAAAPSIISWSDLGHAPGLAPWDLGDATPVGDPGALLETATGQAEVVITAPDPAPASMAAPGPDVAAAPVVRPALAAREVRQRAEPAPAEAAPAAPSRPRVADPVGGPGVGVIPAGGLGRARYRTAAGGTEVAWRPAVDPR